VTEHVFLKLAKTPFSLFHRQN